MSNLDDDPVTVTHAEAGFADVERRDVASHFTLLGMVGKGGMGDVHLARDPDLGRKVALKVMNADDDVLKSRFLTEAQVTAQLEHPNIVPVYALEDDDGLPAFSMKLVRGRTLKQLVKRCRERLEAGEPLGEHEDLNARLELFVKVCDALSYSHARGVIHRDLKPANIMVGAFGEAYVMDWGIAKVVGHNELQAHLSAVHAEKVHETRFGAVLGSAPYMSPEQASGMHQVGARSDQYSLGLILQEIVTLQRALDAKTAEMVLIMARDGQRSQVKHITDVPIHPDLVAIIDKATAFEPAARYPSVEALGEDVRRFLHGEETHARPDNFPRWAWRWLRAHPVATVASISIVVLSAALVSTSSVAGVLFVQQESIAREQANNALVSQVSRRSHDIDNQLLAYQALLEGVAQSTAQLWNHGSPGDGPIYHRADLRDGRGPGDYRHNDRYGMKVTFSDPLTLKAPGVAWGQVEPDVRRLMPMGRVFRTAFVRTHSEQAATWPLPRQLDLLHNEGVAPAWVYVGLQNGVLLNYPGLEKLSRDYDPRLRPWYAATRGTRGPRWGTPYPDDSGFAILLPCNEAIYDADGSFIGVAGLDVDLDTVIGMLTLPGVDRVENTWLVDGEGRIVVDSKTAGTQMGAGLNQNQALERKDFPYRAPRAAIAAGRPFGNIEVDGGRVVFNKMKLLGWYYVAMVPRALQRD